jgi:hypothetical protein
MKTLPSPRAWLRLQDAFVPTMPTVGLEVWERIEEKNHANSGTAPFLQHFTTHCEEYSSVSLLLSTHRYNHFQHSTFFFIRPLNTPKSKTSEGEIKIS